MLASERRGSLSPPSQKPSYYRHSTAPNQNFHFTAQEESINPVYHSQPIGTVTTPPCRSRAVCPAPYLFRENERLQFLSPGLACCTPDTGKPVGPPPTRTAPGQYQLTARQAAQLRTKRQRGTPIKVLVEEYGLSKATVFRYLK